MITGRDFIIISSIDWNFLWQGPQEIAVRLGSAGNRVLYIENTGVRAPGLRDTPRVARRLRNGAGALVSRAERQVAPNVYVCSPFIMPPFGPSYHRTINSGIFLPLIARAAARLQMSRAIVMTFLPTDTAVQLVRHLKPISSLLVYYCVADFSELASRPLRLQESEREMLGLSDLVLAQCDKLAHRCSQVSDNVHILPYGVNLEAFPLGNGSHSISAAGHDGHLPLVHGDKMNVLPRPVIGYVGGLHRHVDFELLATMAQQRPRWSWVCVGPSQTAARTLTRLPNVHLLGEQLHENLAAYMQHFDVGIVPYLENSYTDTVVPTKINEYLAMGKPVVSTALPAVRAFNASHEGVITSAAQPGSFIEAIERALSLPADDDTRKSRRDIAALSDWETQLELACGLIEKTMKAMAHGSNQERFEPD
ncbi:MAG: glycosyltransferase [Pyrinomonadaceae bacterium]